jgi:hypothetical protein
VVNPPSTDIDDPERLTTMISMNRMAVEIKKKRETERTAYILPVWLRLVGLLSNKRNCGQGMLLCNWKVKKIIAYFSLLIIRKGWTPTKITVCLISGSKTFLDTHG